MITNPMELRSVKAEDEHALNEGGEPPTIASLAPSPFSSLPAKSPGMPQSMSILSPRYLIAFASASV